MQITAITERQPGRVEIEVDGSLRLALPVEVAFSEGLRVGEQVSESRLQALERRGALWHAREAALNLLSHRARTRAELQRRLRQKGYAAEIIEETLEALAQRGYLDDSAFAESFVRDRVRLRPRGSRQLVQELRTRGVDSDTARLVVDDVLRTERTSEAALAREAASRWRRRAGEPVLRARRRLYGFLARRGFSNDVILEVVDETLP